MHINPDHYLLTPQGRVWTPQRSQQAWDLAYAELEQALKQDPPKTLYLVCGIQGSGKTTWIQQHRSNRFTPERIVYFDAALPARKHRQRAIALAQETQTPIVAIWLNTPLALALERNAQRALDEIIPEETIRHVFSIFEPPSLDEGFVQVIEVNDN